MIYIGIVSNSDEVITGSMFKLENDKRFIYGDIENEFIEVDTIVFLNKGDKQ